MQINKMVSTVSSCSSNNSDSSTHTHPPVSHPPSENTDQNKMLDALSEALTAVGLLSAAHTSHNSGSKCLKQVSLPVFDGNSSFDEFLATFDALVHKTNENDTIKMIRLKECLKSAPLELIARIANTTTGYNSSRKLLTENYGGAQRDISRYLRDARYWQPLSTNDHKGIVSYRNSVQGLVSSITGT